MRTVLCDTETAGCHKKKRFINAVTANQRQQNESQNRLHYEEDKANSDEVTNIPRVLPLRSVPDLIVGIHRLKPVVVDTFFYLDYESNRNE